MKISRDKNRNFRKKMMRRCEKRKQWNMLLHQYGEDILASDKFLSTKHNIQHGTIPVSRHCIDVARESIALSRKFGIKCEEKDLIRGALLHDYFLYDWHDKDRENYQFLHGFYHPGIALRNADHDYELSPREKDIIVKHMWPLTVVPPMCREAWIVSAADKYCSILETLKIRKGAVKVKA